MYLGIRHRSPLPAADPLRAAVVGPSQLGRRVQRKRAQLVVGIYLHREYSS